MFMILMKCFIRRILTNKKCLELILRLITTRYALNEFKSKKIKIQFIYFFNLETFKTHAERILTFLSKK